MDASARRLQEKNNEQDTSLNQQTFFTKHTPLELEPFPARAIGEPTEEDPI
jgi:hypothetical protein